MILECDTIKTIYKYLTNKYTDKQSVQVCQEEIISSQSNFLTGYLALKTAAGVK